MENKEAATQYKGASNKKPSREYQAAIIYVSFMRKYDDKYRHVYQQRITGLENSRL